jgi:Aerotolerance regulator N-terminal/von Willebrand factor type A domain
MGFLAPAFLVGVLAVGLPLYLHLLRRNVTDPQPFSSLMLFEPRQQSTTRRRRLRYWWLLALRLALLLLLAMTFAEPYVREWLPGGLPDNLLLVAVDNSFSMRAGTRLEDAKRAALALLAARRPGDRAQVLAIGSQAHLLTQPTTDAGALRGALAAIEPSDSRGSFAVLAAAVRTIAESERVPIELHLFSDLQKSNMPGSFSELVLPRNVTLRLHPMAAAPTPNWAVETVSAPSLVWDPHTTHVQAVISGYGTPAATRTVAFVVNGKTLATRQLDIPPSGRATAEIDSLELPYGFSRCSVSLEGSDALPADDQFVFAIERADRKRGLFVFQSFDTRSALYFESALGAAAPAAVVLDKMPVARAADADLSSYAFVVLSDVAALPDYFTRKLVDYVRRGGNVLAALGTVAAQQREVPVIGGGLLPPRLYSRDTERFASVGQVDTAYPPAGSPQEWEGVRVFYAARVNEEGARVAVRLQDGTPLVLEKPLGEGRVVLFASGFDNLTNDLPLHPAFVAFSERISRYLSGTGAQSGPRRVDEAIALRRAKEQAIGVEVIDPSGARPLSLQESVSAQSFELSRAGFYELRVASGRRELVAVNVDRRESDLTPLDDDVLALWRGSSPVPREAAQGAPSPAQPAAAVAVPRSLWWYAMFGVLVVALAESALASRYLTTRWDEP